MSVALELAEYVHDLRAADLDGDDREAVLRCVLDLTGAAAAGFPEKGVRAAERAASSMFAGAVSDIWFAGRKANAYGALFANATAAAALDLDDGHRIARGHPGAAVIPAVCALQSYEKRRADDADEFMAAVVAGYEAGVRMAAGRLQYAPSGAWAPYAVIAAVGRLRGVSPQIMAQAFGIAAQSAPALPGLAGIMGSDVKEGIAWGAVTGLSALELAQQGFSGPAHIFDEPALFAADRIRAELGGKAMIHGIYLKPFACCRHAHAPVQAYLSVAAAHGIEAADVIRVKVHTYRATFNLANMTQPRTLVQAQYSVPFCIGAAAVHGGEALLPMRHELLDDAAVVALAGRVELDHAPDIEACFPVRSPSRVTVESRKGTFTSAIVDASGDWQAPFTQAEVESKFTTATRHVMTPARQREIVAGVTSLREGLLEPLFDSLRRPLDA